MNELLIDNDEFSITKQHHNKKDIDIFVVRQKVRGDSETFSEMRQMAKLYNGYYSTFRGVNGFVFEEEDDAKEFCEVVLDWDSMDIPEYERPQLQTNKGLKKKSIATHQTRNVAQENITTKKMELYSAIKNIVNLCGVDILKEQRILNILSDFSAYDSLPSSKFILKNIIEEGIMTNLLAKSKWDLSCDKLVDTFVTSTGFQKDNVSYIFNCIGYGLGWTNNAPIMPSNNTLQTSNKPIPSTIDNNVTKHTVTPTPGKRMSKDDMFDYLLSIVEIDPSIDSVTGLTINQVSFEITNSKEFSFICEISGKMKINSCYLNFCIYDNNNRIRKDGISFVWCERYSGFEVMSIYINSPISIANISKCKVFVSQVIKR